MQVQYRVKKINSKVIGKYDHNIKINVTEVNETQLPLDPIGPPRLIPDNSTERPGQFIVDLSDAAPQPQDAELVTQTFMPAVTFLFKFQEVDSHNVSYEWLVRKKIGM